MGARGLGPTNGATAASTSVVQSVGGSTSTTGVGCSTSIIGVDCSTSTTAGGTGVCSAGSQLAVAGTGFRRDRRRRRVSAGVIRFYIFIFLSLLCKFCFMLKKCKMKKMRRAGAIPDANGRAWTF
jgi:hypothetical protein